MESTFRPYIHALALGLDAGWRRLPPPDRIATGEAFVAALDADPADEVTTYTYSMIGLEPGVDLLLWRLAPSLDALEQAAARTLREGLGPWLTVRQSFLGLINASQYVAKASSQEQSMFEGERSKYIVVYPFTKSTDWYLLGREARQGIMNEHMRVGRQYPQVRQLLAYSFGLDDQDFVVAYETDDLPGFGELVRELRSTDSRRSTVKDTPILAGVHRPIAEILALLGAVETEIAPRHSAAIEEPAVRGPASHELARRGPAIEEPAVREPASHGLARRGPASHGLARRP